MSDIPADSLEILNIRDIVARIDRQLAETRKFVAEHDKLAAEAAKLARERRWFPVQVGIAFMAAGGALVGGTVALMRLVGG